MQHRKKIKSVTKSASTNMRSEINALIQKNKEMEVQMQKLEDKFEDIIWSLKWNLLKHKFAINGLLKEAGKEELEYELGGKPISL